MVKVIQISVGGFDNNFSYLVIEENSIAPKGVLIDPTGDLKTIQSELEKNRVKLVMQLITHAHPDHCELIEHFKSKGIKLFSPAPKELGFTQSISAGNFEIKVIHFPGHTNDSVCFLIEDNLFSGDTLFFAGIGTTAYGGNELELTKSLDYLCALNPKLKLWPGHDYGGSHGTLGEALKNSYKKPSGKTHEKIKNKVKEYESNRNSKNKF